MKQCKIKKSLSIYTYIMPTRNSANILSTSIQTNRWYCSLDRSVEYVLCVLCILPRTQYKLTHASCLTQLSVAIWLIYVFNTNAFCHFITYSLLECVSAFISFILFMNFVFGLFTLPLAISHIRWCVRVQRWTPIDLHYSLTCPI